MSQVDNKQGPFCLFRVHFPAGLRPRWGWHDTGYSRRRQESLLLMAGSSQQVFCPLQSSTCECQQQLSTAAQGQVLSSGFWYHDSAARSIAGHIAGYMIRISLCNQHKECYLCNYKTKSLLFGLWGAWNTPPTTTMHLLHLLIKPLKVFGV